MRSKSHCKFQMKNKFKFISYKYYEKPQAPYYLSTNLSIQKLLKNKSNMKIPLLYSHIFDNHNSPDILLLCVPEIYLYKFHNQ